MVPKIFLPVYDTIPNNTNAKKKTPTFTVSTEIKGEKILVYICNVSLLMASKYFAKIILKETDRWQLLSFYLVDIE